MPGTTRPTRPATAARTLLRTARTCTSRLRILAPRLARVTRNVPPLKTRNAVNCTPDAFRIRGRFSDANWVPFRYRGFMSGEEQRGCPQCGAPVSYAGRGRRPVWCSSRCRNIAAVTRRGAREAAVQIRMIDVPKAPKPRPERTPTQEERDESAHLPSGPILAPVPGSLGSAAEPPAAGRARQRGLGRHHGDARPVHPRLVAQATPPVPRPPAASTPASGDRLA